MLAGKALLGYIDLFSPNDYKKNVKIIYKYFNSDLRLTKIDETRNYLKEI